MSHRTSRFPHQLLRAVREIADGVRLIWGAPAHVAIREVMPRAEHQRLAVWIGWLERTTRALVVFLALRLIPQLALPEPASRKPRPRIPELWLCSPTYPAGWRAPFSIPVQRQHDATRHQQDTPRREPPLMISIQRLAIRFEAATRVLADPRRRVRLHAFRLMKLARDASGANKANNSLTELPRRIVEPLLPLARRNPPHHARIAMSAAKQAFNGLIPAILDLLESGVLNPRPG